MAKTGASEVQGVIQGYIHIYIYIGISRDI